MPTELVDLFPTLCELSDLIVPEDLDGISLAPLIHGNDLSEPPRLYAISQFPKGTRMGYALRDERYRFIAWYETGGIGAQPNRPIDAAELYDYKMDPLEQRNLVNDPKYKETIEQLSAELNNFLYSLQSK